MSFYSKYIVPRILEHTMSLPAVTKYRKKTLAKVDPNGDILEIGFGTGLNLPFYPKGVKKISIVDDNEGMLGFVKKRIDDSPIEVDMRILSAEKLPYGDASFDTVVSTWTMCSISNLGQALKEIYRVLKPNGKFIFVEHGLCKNSSYVRRVQRILNPINMGLGGNCQLTRDIAEIMKNSSFKLLEFGEELVNHIPRTHGYIYFGVAGK